MRHHQTKEKKIVFKKDHMINKRTTLFEKEFGITLAKDDWIGYDFEAMLVKDTTMMIGKQKLLSRHQPIAFVMMISGIEMISHVDINAGKLFVETLENKMEELKNKLDESFKQKFKLNIMELFKTKCKCMKKKSIYQTDHETKCEAKKIYKRLLQEHRQVPVIGFNSGKYDLTFIIPHLKKYEIKLYQQRESDNEIRLWHIQFYRCQKFLATQRQLKWICTDDGFENTEGDYVL